MTTTQDQINKLKELKTKTLIQAKKGEYWIRDTKEEYYFPLVKDFEECRGRIKQMIQIKKNPWHIHLIAQTMVFIRNPIKYFTVRIKARKHFINSYWEMKKLIKEYDDDFLQTEDAISRDYQLIKDATRLINKMENFLNKKVQQ
jgi:hypothetical protein